MKVKACKLQIPTPYDENTKCEDFRAVNKHN